MRTRSLLAKEWMEMVRSYRILFVPLLFALLAIAKPVGDHLLPELLKTGSSLPPGTVIKIPLPTPPEVLASVLGQLGQVGVLVLILVTMGSVAGERLSGAAAVTLSKPVGRGTYFGAKLAAYCALGAIGLVIGVLGGAYYTNLLIGPVPWGPVLLGALLYLPIVLLPVAVTLSASVIMPSPLAAGGTGLLAVFAANTLPQYLGNFVKAHSPSALADAAGAVMGGDAAHAALSPLFGTILLVAAFAAIGWVSIRRVEF